MNVKLISDFIDYYDHWFDLTGYRYERLSITTFSRKQILNYLKHDLNLNVPIFGNTKKVYKYFKNKNNINIDNIRVVVYLDYYSHRGIGKLRTYLKDAINKYPNRLCCEYIENTNSTSYRYLQIGNYCFWLKYKSDDSWKSNCGENINIKLLKYNNNNFYKIIKYPLFAIDFVLGNQLYAVDFNISPGLKNTGIEDILSPKNVVLEIKNIIEYALNKEN